MLFLESDLALRPLEAGNVTSVWFKESEESRCSLATFFNAMSSSLKVMDVKEEQDCLHSSLVIVEHELELIKVCEDMEDKVDVELCWIKDEVEEELEISAWETAVAETTET